MFSGMQAGSQIWLLKKGNKLELQTGSVVNRTDPRPKNPTQYNAFGFDMIVDLTVKTEDGQSEFKAIPANATRADFGNVTLAETKEQMLSEVNAIVEAAQADIDAVELKRQIVNDGKKIQLELNPTYAKEVAQEEKINKLESGMQEIRQMLARVLKAKED